MKKFLPLFLFLLGLFCAVESRAGTTNLLNLSYVNGTNNGNVFSLSGVYIPPQKFIIQNLSITNANSGSYTTNGITNAVLSVFEISVDPNNTNWLALATNVPFGTNATVDSFNPSLNTVTLYGRLRVVTTNAIGVATFLTQ